MIKLYSLLESGLIPVLDQAYLWFDMEWYWLQIQVYQIAIFFFWRGAENNLVLFNKGMVTYLIKKLKYNKNTLHLGGESPPQWTWL